MVQLFPPVFAVHLFGITICRRLPSSQDVLSCLGRRDVATRITENGERDAREFSRGLFYLFMKSLFLLLFRLFCYQLLFRCELVESCLLCLYISFETWLLGFKLFLSARMVVWWRWEMLLQLVVSGRGLSVDKNGGFNWIPRGWCTNFGQRTLYIYWGVEKSVDFNLYNSI